MDGAVLEWSRWMERFWSSLLSALAAEIFVGAFFNVAKESSKVGRLN